MATYLVTQATGQQSRRVVANLLAAGAKIHAVVRDIQKVPPILQDSNITLFQGESKNFEDIFAAAQGCKGVFLNTVPFPGLESLQAKTVVEACKKAGVESIVAATTFTVGNKDMWDDDETREIQLLPYFASKAEVEDIVRGGGFQAYTIIRPAVIHHDFFLPSAANNFPRLSTHGEISDLLVDCAKMPFTDADDIGKYVAAALQDPTRFGGQEIDIAGALLTLQEVRDILVKVSGCEVQVVKRTVQEMKEMGIMAFGLRIQLWANTKEFDSSIATTKRASVQFGIPFTSLEDALQRDKVQLLECIATN
ncbi:NmrA-like family protein [Xylariales sp. PMI_506]|nr:NmrA-like family protein [Xylariales sp. PMI_506]